MLDQQLTIEGLVSIVLMTKIESGKYYFLTKSDGHTPVKTPMDMFADTLIDNDLKAVDTAIREYYGLNDTKEDNKNE